ncbi:unnamed protein product [Thelazia callipaeda]|uniref:SWI/SNF-related matrix-associated actin-dependent regulator of chromatin subfamily A-like protein 1 n=1 Tax=Thelazia callipaeda TaxID=103827 RepID=A0A0N5DAA3_THECL|nr:unnamed protein product [Thelazia callipaeda]
MASNLSLTVEQLKRIERNRAEAVRRMALRQQRGIHSSPTVEDISAINHDKNEINCGSSSLSSMKIELLPDIVSSDSSKQTCPSLVKDSNTVIIDKGSTLPCPPALSKYVINYRDEPSSSKIKENSKEALPPSSIKLSSVVTTVELRQSAVSVTFKLIDPKSFQVQFKPFNHSVVNALKAIPSKAYDPHLKTWVFPLEDVSVVENALQAMDDVSLEIEKFSDHVVKTLLTYGKSFLGFKEPNLEAHIEKTLLDALFPYQRRGVIHGIIRRGRLLLADEMGLGKSIQALGIARYFKHDWPLLIICPSSVKFSWLNQFENFLPTLLEIVIIEKGIDRLPPKKSKQTVVIMSYDLMVSKRSHIFEYDFKSIIFDESHLLKDGNAQRTKAATDISRRALRVILLTGTPALSRPVELFSQIRIIDPKMFPNYRDFAIRYCDGKQGKFSFEAKGCTNSDELAVILSGSVMLRRLKQDVLNDLPMKRREVVYLKDDSIYTNIVKLRDAKAAFNGAKQRLVEYYYETGIAKARSVARYIIDHYFFDGAPKRKVLIFAHHQMVLDTISMDIAKKGLRSIRIDGTTISRSRDEQCRLFQENEEVVVAVLSITAAGIGITLTAASVVVFAELHWNPGTMKQAEDRAHRVGQKDSVFVQYLIAKGTADDVLWPMIQKKLDVLLSCNLSSDTYRGTESVQTTIAPEMGSLNDYFPKLKKVRSLTK